MLQPNDGISRHRHNMTRRSQVWNRAAGSGKVRAAPVEARSRTYGKDDTGVLFSYYRRLLAALGPQGWWPARARLEVILGAILTQNTAWTNAARAIQQLRKRGALGLTGLLGLSEVELQSLIRPAGFFVQKARAIRGFVSWLETTHSGSLDRMFAMPADELRTALLSLRGLGPETADAILLYAGGKPFFVADAYTRRILARHHHVAENSSYQEAQDFIHRHLNRDAVVYNEFHALLVEVGKRYCRRNAAHCENCPLQEFLPVAQAPGLLDAVVSG